mmetsp:Transcript_14357/g.39387  ORF Transcript_14357/g.39387 Transcript_14357/m.39387 type:complete len:216 (-) Transcript_14357:727-1374(-)
MRTTSDSFLLAVPKTLTPACLSSPRNASECMVGNPGGRSTPSLTPSNKGSSPPKHLRSSGNSPGGMDSNIRDLLGKRPAKDLGRVERQSPVPLGSCWKTMSGPGSFRAICAGVSLECGTDAMHCFTRLSSRNGSNTTPSQSLRLPSKSTLSSPGKNSASGECGAVISHLYGSGSRAHDCGGCTARSCSKGLKASPYSKVHVSAPMPDARSDAMGA